MEIMGSVSRVKSLFIIMILSVIMVVGAERPAYANFPPVVQTYYVPLAEPLLFDAMVSIFPATVNCPDAPAVGSPITTIVSMVATADNTLIYYDHWEDGFEVDITLPTQPTTQIWGDDNDTNGIAPGFTNDILNAGTHVELESAVNINNPLAIDFDGGDKISASQSIVSSRVGWSSGPNTLFAGATELLDTDRWGMAYEIPVDNSSDIYQTFEHVSLFLMAAEDNTVISIDQNGDDIVDVTETLNKGESHHENGGLVVGAHITATKPVQAQLVTGDVCTAYETRWYTLVPTAVWDDSYYMPVTTTSSYPTAVFLYNPQNFPIDITWAELSGPGGVVTVLPSQSQRVTIPYETAVHFTSANFPFYAVAATDTNDSYDWGFALWPEQLLTQRAQVAWGPGRDPTVSSAENGNPLWVTVVPEDSNQTIVKLCVDYEGDGVDDIFYMLEPLVSQKIFTSFANQTGVLISICDGSGAKVAAAWGPQPGLATIGLTGIDLGTAVVPLSDFDAGLGANVANDADGDGLPSGSDTLSYTIVVQNTNLPSLGNIVSSSTVPSNTTYILNSTTVDYGTGPQTIPDNGVTAFPLDEGGATLTGAMGQNPVTVEFDVIIDSILPSDVQSISAAAIVQAAGEQRLLTVETPLNFEPSILLNKTVYQGHNSGIGCSASGENVTAAVNSPITYCFTITNTGDTHLDSLTLDDAALAISLADVTLVGTAFSPLPPGASLTYYYETTLTADLLNTAVVAAVPVDAQGTPHPQLPVVQDDDTASVEVAQGPTATPTDTPTITATPTSTPSPTTTPTEMPSAVTIGDIIWLDDNGNGVQDSNEAGQPNVTVNLYDDSGNLLATTLTDSDGRYLFADGNVAAGLQPNSTYHIKLDNPVNFRVSDVLGKTILTEPDLGSDEVDSDGVYDVGGYPTIDLVTTAGENTTYDFGLRIGRCLDDIAFTMASSGLGTATIQNNNSELSYVVGLAVYEKIDNTIANQKLFDFQVVKIAPQQSMQLQVDLPGTAAQIDLFCGPVLYSLENHRYQRRLLAVQHISGGLAGGTKRKVGKSPGQPIGTGIDDPVQ